MTSSEGLCSELMARCLKYIMKHKVFFKKPKLQTRARLCHWLLHLWFLLRSSCLQLYTGLLKKKYLRTNKSDLPLFQRSEKAFTDSVLVFFFTYNGIIIFFYFIDPEKLLTPSKSQHFQIWKYHFLNSKMIY